MPNPVHNTAIQIAHNLDEVLRLELHAALEHAEAEDVPPGDAMAAMLTTLLTASARIGIVCCTPDRFLMAASRCYESVVEMMEEENK